MVARVVFWIVVALLVRTLGITRRLCDFLLRTVARHGQSVDKDGLRAVGRELVSVAGELTTLGVRMARSAPPHGDPPGPGAGQRNET